jgi:hypothetical protein
MPELLPQPHHSLADLHTSSSSQYPRLSRPSWRSIHWCQWTNSSTVQRPRSLVPWFPRHIFDAHTTGFTVFVWRGNTMNHQHRLPPSTNLSINTTSGWIAEFGVLGRIGCVSSADRIGGKMMEPSLQRRGTPKAWGSPCKKREGFSSWKGRSPRIAEWGGGCTLGGT